MSTKRILSVILTLVMVVGLLSSFTLTANAEETSGNCGKDGDNVTWKYNAETKTITFSGIGIISNYTVGERPWESYMSDIENVIIESGVTAIGEYVLSECSSLKSISIPESVEKINSQAFSYCTGLKEVIIPNGVKSIFNSAFARTGLEKVTIGNDISMIYSTVFYGCENLKYVIIGGGINTVRDAFWNCSQLTDVYINCTKAAWEARSNRPTFATAYNEPSYPTLHFTDDTTMITFDAVGGSCSLPIALVNENKKLSELPIPIKDKCSFDGWYDAKEGGDKITTDTIFTESATIYAHWTTDTQHEIDFEGVCDTEYTIIVEVADYLPADADITSMSGSLALVVGKSQNITYTSDVSKSYAKLYTKICNEPATDTYTVTVNTSNYGTITIAVNITLLGYKINSYDASAKSASVSFKEAGTHSVIFASFTGSQLLGIDIVDYTVEDGGTFDVPQEDTSFTANKIMLWSNTTTLVPMCEAYIVK